MEPFALVVEKYNNYSGEARVRVKTVGVRAVSFPYDFRLDLRDNIRQAAREFCDSQGGGELIESRLKPFVFLYVAANGARI